MQRFLSWPKFLRPEGYEDFSLPISASFFFLARIFFTFRIVIFKDFLQVVEVMGFCRSLFGLNFCKIRSRWWFQTFFMFTPTWGNDPI